MQKLTLLLCFAVTLSNSSPLHFKSPIRAGSTFGIISPAGCTPNPLEFQSKLTQQLESAGYKVKFSPVWSNCVGYLAGTDQDRANSVNQMFRDESVDIIMAARGGWGCARLLELIDYSAIQSNPKPIIGYSDLTALLNAITQKTGLFTLHGPLGLTNWDLEKGNYYWFDQVVGRGNRVVKFFQDLKMNSTTIRSGKAKGRLIGGNLSVFVAILGSDFLPKDYSDAILFFEDVNEPSYSIDRMLTHLELAGVLKQARGFIWGSNSDCGSEGFTVKQVVEQHISKFSMPSFYGFQFGHISEQFTLPIGAQVSMDADEFTLELHENIFVPEQVDSQALQEEEDHEEELEEIFTSNF